MQTDASPVGSGKFAVYLSGRPQLRSKLLEGCGAPDLALHCGLMLRSCARSEQLVACLLADGALLKLLGLAQHQCFEISCDAFASLRELLCVPKAVTAEHL